MVEQRGSISPHMVIVYVSSIAPGTVAVWVNNVTFVIF